MDHQESQEDSSDDDLFKPASIPSQLFQNGPLKLKAYREVFKRTLAQPRMCPEIHLRADVNSKKLEGNALKILETRPIQCSITKPDNISEFLASQTSGTDINRSPASSPEPDGIKGASIPNASAFCHDESMVQGSAIANIRLKKKSKTSNESLAYVCGESKAKKQFTVKRPLPSRTSLDESDLGNTPQHLPPKKTARKRRRLPQCNELIMVPVLNDDVREIVGIKGVA